MVVLGQKPRSSSSKGAWNRRVLSPGCVLGGQELSQRLGRRAFQGGITWEEAKRHKWRHDHSGLVLWPPRRLREIHEYLGLSRLAHETLPLRNFFQAGSMPQRLEDPDTSLRQPWGLTYSSKAASSWSRWLRPLPPVAELSLDVDVYRSGHFETNDKQAKVRLPGIGSRPGAQEPDLAHRLNLAFIVSSGYDTNQH